MYDIWRSKLDKVINEAHQKANTSVDAKQIQAIKQCILDNDRVARSINDLFRQKEELEN